MHCFDVQLELEAYADGELGPERAALLELHLASCDDCRAELARLQTVVEALESWPLVVEPAQLTNRIMAQVSSRSVVSAIEPPTLPRFRLRWSDLAISLAGGGLVFVATLIWLRLSTTSTAHLQYRQIVLRLEMLGLKAQLMIQHLARIDDVTWGLVLVGVALAAVLVVVVWSQVALYFPNGRPRTITPTTAGS
jgi:anti-sigma factor RsiW